MSFSNPFCIFSPKVHLHPLPCPSPKSISKTSNLIFLGFHHPPRPSLPSKPYLTSCFCTTPSPTDRTLNLLPPNLQSIVKQFQSVQDPRSKYEQLLFYGRNLPPLDPRFKTPANKVQGCVSQVWVRAFLDDAGRSVRFEADSDSSLTKGLAALLVEGLSGSSPSEIARLSPNFVQMLGLQQSLTPSRSNGFLNMLKLMQRKAIELEEGTSRADGACNQESADKDGDSAAQRNSDLKLNANVHGTGGVDRNPTPDTPNFPKLGSRGERIKRLLEAELSPVELEVEDISHRHARHVGAGDGETHFDLRIVSEEFEGKSLVKRHRMVYDFLQEELKNGLHALSIVAKAPSEI